MGQLFLGPCPRSPPFVENLDIEKYSGNWYVVAQSLYHPLKASDCEKVTYSVINERLSANFSFMENDANRKNYRNAVLIREPRAQSGNLKLKFEDFPRTYQFRVLKTNYTDVAVEYTCLSGVFNYTASVTVLHRRAPGNLGDLNAALHQLKLTSDVAPHFRKNMRLINQSKC